MKLPGYAPSASDRASTREELFEVLELLGGFEETSEPELGETGDRLACLEEQEAQRPSIDDLLEEVCSNEERLLMEIEPFNSLIYRKAQRIN